MYIKKKEKKTIRKINKKTKKNKKLLTEGKCLNLVTVIVKIKERK